MKTNSDKKSKFTLNKKLVAIVLLIISACAFLYPFLGNIISYFQQLNVVHDYEEQIAQLSENEVQSQKKLAEEYNKKIMNVDLQESFKSAFNTDSTDNTDGTEQTEEESEDDYYKALSFNSDNMMGYIKIPKISVTCPIYHDATEAQLQKGIGHLQGTFLPIGGIGSHCVLTGHTGVPGNMLFTDLDKLEVGDKFYLYVVDEVLAYEVDQIKVVEPSDTSDLQIDPQKDYCTLVTCTPYGINSHRLLVRGERCEYIPDDDGLTATYDESGDIVYKSDRSDNISIGGLIIPKKFFWLIIMIVIIVDVFIIVVIVRRRWKLRRIAELEINEKDKKENCQK